MQKKRRRKTAIHFDSPQAGPTTDQQWLNLTESRRCQLSVVQCLSSASRHPSHSGPISVCSRLPSWGTQKISEITILALTYVWELKLWLKSKSGNQKVKKRKCVAANKMKVNGFLAVSKKLSIFCHLPLSLSRQFSFPQFNLAVFCTVFCFALLGPKRQQIF